MSNKPIIGIVGRSDSNSEKYNIICCYESIRKCIINKGAIPILILPTQNLDYETAIPKEIEKLTIEEKEDLKTILKLCDGILIPGSYKLFEYDKFIYQYTLDNDIPVLGICGGMQLMGLVDNSVSNDILVRNNTNIDHFKTGKNMYIV